MVQGFLNIIKVAKDMLNNNKVKSAKSLKFSFLPEKPIIGDENNPLLFGHKEIVDTLMEIILNSPKDNSLTVGLFGSWGAGKSSIVESLKEQMLQEKQKVPVVVFDVWKYEGDGLRKTFIKQLLSDLRDEGINDTKFLKSDFKTPNEERIDGSETLREEISGINWKRIGVLLGIVLLVYAAFIILTILIFYLVNIKLLVEILHYLFKALFITIPFTLIIDKSIDFIKTNKSTVVTKEKLQDPHEFNNEFKAILQDLKKKARKFVIVFDNMDRVEGEKALKIISTIKTFLESADKEVEGLDVVFLVPCDEAAIKKHVGENDEYLRKFFNTVIHIPTFDSSEIEEFASKLLKQTKLKDFDNETLSSMIALVFRDNPRQIIQFINILLSNYLLIQKRIEAEKGIEKDFLKSNTPQLAKFLLLKLKFPDFMNLKLKNCDFILTIDEPLFSKESKMNGSEELKQEIRDFLLLTENIKIESLEFFYFLRKTDHEVLIPNSNKLIRFMEENRIKEIVMNEDNSVDKSNIDYIRSLKENLNINVFNMLVSSKLKRKNNPVDVHFFINNTFYLVDFLKLDTNDKFYQIIGDKLRKSYSFNYVEHIDIEMLNEGFLKRYNRLEIPLRHHILTCLLDYVFQNKDDKNQIKNKENLEKIVLLQLEQYPYLDNSNRNKLKSIIKDYCSQIKSIIKIVSEDEKLNAELIDDGFVAKFINGVSLEKVFKRDSDIDNYYKFNEKAFRIETLQGFSNISQVFLEGIGENISNENNLKLLISFFSKTISKINSNGVLMQTIESAEAQLLKNSVLKQNNQLINQHTGISIILLCELSKIYKEMPFIRNYHNQIATYLKDKDIEQIHRLHPNPTEVYSNSNIKDILIQITFNNLSIFKSLYLKVHDEYKMELLFNSSSSHAFPLLWQKLEVIDYLIPNLNDFRIKLKTELSKYDSSNDIRLAVVLAKLKFPLNEILKEHFAKNLQNSIDTYYLNQNNDLNMRINLESVISEGARSKVLNIISAKYGSERDLLDITSILQNEIKGGMLNVKVDNKLAQKDPAIGKKKELHVKYDYMGKTDTIVIPENEILILPQYK